MGLVEMGPPKELVLLLKKLLSARNFIETGTYQGNTANWASGCFDNVDTIEYSEALFGELEKKYGNSNNLHLHFGDSRKILPKLSQKLKEPSIFWLDGHWSGGYTYGEADQCPLIDEIDTIVSTTKPLYALLIDDARLFLSPPPKPNDIKQWPTIDIIIDHIRKGMVNPYIVVYNDVIVVVPEVFKLEVSDYIQKVNTNELIKIGKKPKVLIKSKISKFIGIFN